MQGKSLYAILLSIIAVLALALAVLVIFLFTTFNNINKAPAASASTTPTPTARTVPKEEQVELNLYAGEGGSSDAIFNLKSSPAHDSSFLAASISVVYDAGPKSKNLEERTALINNSKSELKEACIGYFRGLTFEDVTDTAAMEKAKETLKDTFNEILGGKDKIIINVVFDKWITQ